MFEDFFKVPPSHMKVPPDHYTKGRRPHQRDTHPCWFRLPPWESVSKPMNFSVLYAETVNSTGSVWFVGSSYVLWNFIAACWICQIWIVFYVESCGVSSAECRVQLVGVNRLSACREFFWVHSWQNGTRCRDGVNVLWSMRHYGHPTHLWAESARSAIQGTVVLWIKRMRIK